MTQAGLLRHRIQIQTETISGTGARGQPIKAWTTTATVPAYLEDLTGRKLEVARQLVEEATHQVSIRYMPGLTTKNTRILFGTRTFNIGAITNKCENNFTLMMTCIEQEGI